MAVTLLMGPLLSLLMLLLGVVAEEVDDGRQQRRRFKERCCWGWCQFLYSVFFVFFSARDSTLSVSVSALRSFITLHSISLCFHSSLSLTYMMPIQHRQSIGTKEMLQELVELNCVSQTQMSESVDRAVKELACSSGFEASVTAVWWWNVCIVCMYVMWIYSIRSPARVDQVFLFNTAKIQL